MPAPRCYVFFGVIWLIALTGIAIKLLWIDAPRLIGTALYLALGWAIAFDFGVVLSMPAPAIALLAAGGLSYTVGGVIYIAKKPNLGKMIGFHELFHLFVIVGSVCHYLMVFLYEQTSRESSCDSRLVFVSIRTRQTIRQTESSLFFMRFRRCCLKTHIQKQLHFIIRNASVKSHRDPARLAHMIRREKSLFSKQRAYQYRITFEINHLQHFFSLQPQFHLWHIHYNGKPFFITAMAEHPIIRILYPRMIRLCTIIIPYIFF